MDKKTFLAFAIALSSEDNYIDAPCFDDGWDLFRRFFSFFSK